MKFLHITAKAWDDSLEQHNVAKMNIAAARSIDTYPFDSHTQEREARLLSQKSAIPFLFIWNVIKGITDTIDRTIEQQLNMNDDPLQETISSLTLTELRLRVKSLIQLFTT